MQPPSDCAANAKDELRARMKHRRASIDSASRERAALALAQKLALSEAWGASQTIANFMSFGSEISTEAIDKLAREQGKIVVYPRVAHDCELTFHHWSPGEIRERSAFGTREPCAQAPTISHAAIDMTLVPLLACDARGFRLGYGGGFYDRFLASSATRRVGIGFHWQLINQVPNEAHDQKLQAFASEHGITVF